MRKLAPLLTVVLLLAASCSSGGSDSSTTTTTKTGGAKVTTSSVPASAKSYATALAKGLTNIGRGNSDLKFDERQAACVGPKWVKIIGVDTLIAKKVSPTDVSASGFAFSSLGLDEGQASNMINAIDGCGVDTIKEFRSVLDAGLDATKKSCLGTELSDTIARQLLEQSLYREQPDAKLKQEISRIDSACQLSAGGTTDPAAPTVDGAPTTAPGPTPTTGG